MRRGYFFWLKKLVLLCLAFAVSYVNADLIIKNVVIIKFITL